LIRGPSRGNGPKGGWRRFEGKNENRGRTGWLSFAIGVCGDAHSGSCDRSGKTGAGGGFGRGPLFSVHSGRGMPVGAGAGRGLRWDIAEEPSSTARGPAVARPRGLLRVFASGTRGSGGFARGFIRPRGHSGVPASFCRQPSHPTQGRPKEIPHSMGRSSGLRGRP